jgi:hypothetical protein
MASPWRTDPGQEEEPGAEIRSETLAQSTKDQGGGGAQPSAGWKGGGREWTLFSGRLP